MKPPANIIYPKDISGPLPQFLEINFRNATVNRLLRDGLSCIFWRSPYTGGVPSSRYSVRHFSAWKRQDLRNILTGSLSTRFAPCLHLLAIVIAKGGKRSNLSQGAVL